MVIDGGGGQDTSFHAADLLSLQVEGDALGVVDIYIGQRDVDTSVLVFGGGSAYHRYFSASAHFGLVDVYKRQWPACISRLMLSQRTCREFLFIRNRCV